jgi:hypothetical protein
VLEIIPEDIISLIINEWLNGEKEYKVVDISLTNNRLREKYLKCKKIVTKPITITNSKKLETFVAWKISRGYTLRTLQVKETLLETHPSNFLSYISEIQCLVMQHNEQTCSKITLPRNCENIPPESLNIFSSLHRFPNLKSLSFTRSCCNSVKLDATKMAFYEYKSMGVLSSLKSIRFAYREFVSKASVLSLFRWLESHCPGLESVELVHCRNVSLEVLCYMMVTMGSLFGRLKTLIFKEYPSTTRQSTREPCEDRMKVVLSALRYGDIPKRMSLERLHLMVDEKALPEHVRNVLFYVLKSCKAYRMKELEVSGVSRELWLEELVRVV